MHCNFFIIHYTHSFTFIICRMRPDVASDVGDMILTFAFLSLAPYVANVFIVALHKGVRSSTKVFLVGAFFPCLPGMTMYR